MKQPRPAIITARCTRSVSQPFQTRYGTRITAEFQTEEGDDIKIFDDPESSLAQCARGMQVELYMGNKGWKLGRITDPDSRNPAPAAGSSQPARIQGAAEDTKSEMERIGREIRRFAYILSTVSQNQTLSSLTEAGRVSVARAIFSHHQNA
jgi:hypothetical protein